MAAALVWPGCLQSPPEEEASELNKEEDTDMWSAKTIPSTVVSKGPVTELPLPCSGQEGYHHERAEERTEKCSVASPELLATKESKPSAASYKTQKMAG